MRPIIRLLLVLTLVVLQFMVIAQNVGPAFRPEAHARQLSYYLDAVEQRSAMPAAEGEVGLSELRGVIEAEQQQRLDAAARSFELAFYSLLLLLTLVLLLRNPRQQSPEQASTAGGDRPLDQSASQPVIAEKL